MKQGLKRVAIVTASGFTILEVMVVVAIIGILLALVTPSIRSMTDKQQVRGACESIYQSLALPRSSAVSLNKNVTFNFRSSNAGATWCIGLSDSGACNCTAPATCTVNSIQRTVSSSDFGGDGGANSTVKVTNIANNTSFTFNARDAAPTPIPTASNDLWVRSNKWACTIRLEPLGQVKYLGIGTGQYRRVIVPLAEAGALN